MKTQKLIANFLLFFCFAFANYYSFALSYYINNYHNNFPYVTSIKCDNSCNFDNSVAKNFSNTDTDIKKIALTFDDGPKKDCTELLLDELRKRNVHVTFFIIGENAANNPEIIKKMSDDGHLIGNHTFTHCNLCNTNINSAIDEINKTNQIIYELTNTSPEYIRPPFGSLPNELDSNSNFNLETVLWNLDTRDWSVLNTEEIVKYVINNVNDGDIILMHDIFPTSVNAAVQIIDILSQQGYEFVTVDNLLNP